VRASTRRAFLARSLAAGGGALLAGPLRSGLARAAAPQGQPNILVVMVDQMRVPMWFPDQATRDRLLPNLARLRSVATTFENHFTASNMCVASRGVLVTGLYPHQTGVMLTKEVTSSTLSAKFPTWGTLLRSEGYATTWYGKWHLGAPGDKTSLEPYGFDGGTYPSPNGNPGEGGDNDPKIVDQFLGWLDGAPRTPWCTTVSLINPHDINWFPNFTVFDEALEPAPDYTFPGAPPNAETAAQLEASKPRLQRALQETTNAACGVVPDSGPLAGPTWARMLKLYLLYHQMVDTQIGRVLDALAARPDLAANTVVVFTSDHGEYAGSHGLRAKGGGAYDEAIHVPLYVIDPRGYLSNGTTSPRAQLTSSADFTPLLLTIARGSSSWRNDTRYAHLARRADLAAIAANPGARGRPWVAHVTDETTVEEFSTDDALSGRAPHHVAAVRTTSAKYAEYSRWKPDTIEVDPSDVDRELYAYDTPRGRMELDNLAGRDDRLQRDMARLLAGPVMAEVRAPLPDALKAARDEGMADYYARTADLTP
jgi:arylsulfatase A-like enzyme